MDKGSSPEEKLLKLIRGRSKISEQSRKGKLYSPKAKAMPAVKKDVVSENFLRPADNFLKNKILPLLKFKTLNLFLFALLVVFIIHLTFQVINPIRNRIQKISKEANAEQEKIADVEIPQAKDYDYYYEQFSKKDIFDAPLSETGTDTSGTSTSAKDAIKNLKLVGIMLGEKPEAIIEDTKDKTTLFLHKGEKLDKLEIKDIQESKIIVIYDGEEFELDL